MSILFLIIGIVICLTYFWFGIYNRENNKNWDLYIDYYYHDPRVLYYIVTFLIGILLSLIWPLFIIPLMMFIIFKYLKR